MTNKLEQDGPAGVQSIRRAALLLRLVTANNRTGMRLVDLYRNASLTRPTAHRLLQALIEERLVQQDTHTKRYFLGALMYEMGLAAAPKMALRDICHPHLQAIADHTGDTVFLTERSGFEGVCIDRTEGAFPIKVFVLDIGRRRPLNVGGGALAILSTLSDGEIDRICKINHKRVLERYPRYSDAVLRECIVAARIYGYALHDILEVPGVRSIAVPIRDADGRGIAAISVSTLANRLEGSRVESVALKLTEAVELIEQKIAQSTSNI